MNLHQLSAKLDNLIQFNIEAEAGSWLAKARLARGADLLKNPAGEGVFEKAKRIAMARKANTGLQKSGWQPGSGY